MKYNININQRVLHNTQLDIIDAAILDWIMAICSSKNESIEEKRIDGMTWIDYTSMIMDMPILRINSRGAITPRIKKLEQEGFIKTKIIGKEGAKRMYVSTTDLIDSLYFSGKNTKELFTKMNKVVHENEQGLVHENERIIILDTNHYTRDTPVGGHTPELALKCFDQFWSVYPNRSSKKKSQEIWARKNLNKHIDKILGFIEEAKKTDRWKKGFIKDPTTFLRNESWCDDLAAYYDRTSSAAGIYSNKVEVDYNKKSITIKSNDRNNNKA